MFLPLGSPFPPEEEGEVLVRKMAGLQSQYFTLQAIRPKPFIINHLRCLFPWSRAAGTLKLVGRLYTPSKTGTGQRSFLIG